MSGGGREDLVVFARRCAMQALREGKPEHLVSGLRAIAVIGADAPGLRSALGLLSFASGRIGANHAKLFAQAVEQASPQLRPLLERLAVSPLTEAGLRDFCGEPLIETLFGRMPIGRGFEPYAPSAPLVEIAIELAAMVSADAYDIDHVEAAKSLPVDWNPDGGVSGAAVVTAIHGAGDYRLSIFVFETAYPLAPVFGAVGAIRVEAGRLAVILAGEAPLETRFTLERFRSQVSAILARFRVTNHASAAAR